MRAGAKKSLVWKYFEKNEHGKSTTCLLCKKIIKYYGGTSNLRQHLLRIHTIQMKESQLLADETFNENEDNIQANNSEVPGSSRLSTSHAEVKVTPIKQLKLFGSKRRNSELSESEIANTDPSVVQNQVFVDCSEEISVNEDFFFVKKPFKDPDTIWTQNETLALIYLYAPIKEKFKDFKKKYQWAAISEELKKLGIDKGPGNCELQWKKLLNTYLRHKQGNRSGKFEFFDELDNIISSDPELKYYIVVNSNGVSMAHSPREETFEDIEQLEKRKKRCCCFKSEKQKRHEDRMALMTKKVEIEERKVTAFEDYLKFLKRNDCVN